VVQCGNCKFWNTSEDYRLFQNEESIHACDYTLNFPIPISYKLAKRSTRKDDGEYCPCFKRKGVKL